MDESMLHSWERPEMHTKFYSEVLSGWDHLGGLGIDNIEMASNGKVYTATTSTHAGYYAVSCAIFKKFIEGTTSI
jgi:hypothetical protein